MSDLARSHSEPGSREPSQQAASASGFDPSRGPVRAAGGGSGDLGALSAGAAKGQWHVDMFPYCNMETGEPEPPQCEGIYTHDEEGGLADSIATCNEREAKFIVALVNAYRSGRLIEAPTPDMGAQGEPVAEVLTSEQAASLAKLIEPIARASRAVGDELGPFRFETGRGYCNLSRHDLKRAERAFKVLSKYAASAQGIEARSEETQSGSAEGKSPVAESDAP